MSVFDQILDALEYVQNRDLAELRITVTPDFRLEMINEARLGQGWLERRGSSKETVVGVQFLVDPSQEEPFRVWRAARFERTPA